ncbi:predicted protein [Naegleria gruberi]|uniref:Predicted protein n=1 Tax=Naegleria gruberi TaxID=5762 RepID=D2V0R3_NAEGR|nr:uncharacterized protein NAEGRDRAFT_62385 [Naegleria gruberi]EFC49772.1 predicted protein [Naegleria gruberi]|eukprot:XP_002682516.1 predicted protein [Naegleria gruberi strain NEG-M]
MSKEELPLDIEDSYYQHQPILQDFSYFGYYPPKHIVDAQQAVKSKLIRSAKKEAAASSSGKSTLRYKKLQEQAKKTKETIKNERENDIMHMLRILKGPDTEKDDPISFEEIRNLPIDNEPPTSSRSSRSESSITYVSKQQSPVKTTRFEDPKLFSLTDREDLLPPKQKLLVLESKITRLKELNKHQAVVDLRTMAIALTKLLYGGQSVRLAEHYLDIGDSYTKIKAYEQASSYLKKGLMLLTQIISNQSFPKLINEGAPEVLDIELEYQDARKLLPHVLLQCGKCYIDQGLMKEAYGCLKEAKRQVDALEEDERDVTITFDISLQLSYLYTRMQRYDVSLAHLIQAWESKLNMSGTSTHPDIAKVFREMAYVHIKNGTTNEAIENFQKAKKVYEDLGTGVDLLNAAVTSYTIAGLYRESQNLNKSIEFYQDASKGVESYYGPYHKKTIRVFEKFASSVLEDAQARDNDREGLTRAILIYKELQKRKTKLHGSDSQEVAVTLETLGDIEYAMESYANALLYYEKAWLLCEEILGSSSYNTISLNEKRTRTKQVAKQQEEEDLRL